MARPRKATDQDILAAARVVMGMLGPSEWRLSDVASEAGLSASAIVQRFGSKHALMVAVTEELAASTASSFAELRAQHRSPTAALRAYGRRMAEMALSPAALAHHFAYLQLDLQNPELRANLRRHARETRRQITRLLDDAAAAGELRRDANTRSLACTVEVVIHGALLTWALHTEGTAAALVERELMAALRPGLPSARLGDR